jgi:hypothetical protein
LIFSAISWFEAAALLADGAAALVDFFDEKGPASVMPGVRANSPSDSHF